MKKGVEKFITISLGLGKSVFEKMASKICLQVHAKGQGKEGFKRAVLFPKIVFLYDENLHDEGCELEDVFDEGVSCSMKTMYPNHLGY